MCEGALEIPPTSGKSGTDPTKGNEFSFSKGTMNSDPEREGFGNEPGTSSLDPRLHRQNRRVAGLATSGMREQVPEETGRCNQYRWHEAFNLCSLPLVLVLCTAGAVGAMDGWYSCAALFGHILFDTVWITWKPEALPRWAAVIQIHHLITLLLLLHPLRYPEHAVYACYEGMCEYNTFFLIARRQFKCASKVMNFFFWATFVPTRIVVFPVVMGMCPQLLQGHGLGDKINVYGCQVGLLLFNCLYLYSILRPRKPKVG